MIDTSEILATPSFRPTVSVRALDSGETAFARDVAEQFGLVATVKRSGRGGQKFYLGLWVHERGSTRWGADAVFENGDVWPRAPWSARPQSDEPIQVLSGVTGRMPDAGRPGFAVFAGVAADGVATLAIESALDAHEVTFEEAHGQFAAIALLDDRGQFRLTARRDDGTAAGSRSFDIEA
jgi:hypothetical protein